MPSRKSEKKTAKHPQQSKSLIIFSVVLSLVVVLLAVSGMVEVIYTWYLRDPWIYQPRHLKMLQQIPPVSEWQVYTDPSLHVRFKYPPVVTISTLGPDKGFDDYMVYATFNNLVLSRLQITSFSSEAEYNERFQIGRNNLQTVINGKTFFHGAPPTGYYFYSDKEHQRFLEVALESYLTYSYNEPRTQHEVDKILEEMKQSIVIEE
jgi:hypothetical protein